MSSEYQSQLSNLALRVTEAVESADAERLREVFTPDARVDVNGRFATADEIVKHVAEFLSRVEHPQLDIVSVDESEIGEAGGLVAVGVELVWVDRHAWEEHLLTGSLIFQLTASEQGCRVSGLTAIRAQARQDDALPGAESVAAAEAQAATVAAPPAPPVVVPGMSAASPAAEWPRQPRPHFRSVELFHLLGIYQVVVAGLLRPLDVGNREFLESLLADSRALGQALAQAPALHGEDRAALGALLAAVAAQEPGSAAAERARQILEAGERLVGRTQGRRLRPARGGELDPLPVDYARLTVVFGPGLGLGDQIMYLSLLRALAAHVPGAEITVFTLYPGLWAELLPAARERSYRGDPLRPFRFLRRDGAPGRELVVAADFGANDLHRGVARPSRGRDVLEVALGPHRAWFARAGTEPVRTEQWPMPAAGGYYALLAAMAGRLCPAGTPWPVWEAAAPRRRPQRPPCVLVNPLSSKRFPFGPEHWAAVLARLDGLVGGLQARVFPGVHPASRASAMQVVELARAAGVQVAPLDEGEAPLTPEDGVARVCRAAREADLCLTVDTFTAHLVPLFGTPTVTLTPVENRAFWAPAPWNQVRVVPTPDAAAVESLAQAAAAVGG